VFLLTQKAIFQKRSFFTYISTFKYFALIYCLNLHGFSCNLCNCASLSVHDALLLFLNFFSNHSSPPLTEYFFFFQMGNSSSAGELFLLLLLARATNILPKSRARGTSKFFPPSYQMRSIVNGQRLKPVKIYHFSSISWPNYLHDCEFGQ